MTHFHHWAKGLALAFILGVTACGGGDKPQSAEETGVLQNGEIVPRDRNEARAAQNRERARQAAIDKAEADFTYFRYRIDLSADQPKACFVFSDALDPETDFAPYVEFRPAFRAAFSVEGRELCVGGLSFGEERVAVLKSGLPAAENGKVLATSQDVPISFEDRPPYVGFKGAGIILPREDADGLPIETVNVDMVNITVSKVNDRALVNKSLDNGETTEQGRDTYLWGDRRADDVSTPVWSGTMNVKRAQNTPVVTVFPLADVIGALDAGAYFVRIEDAREISQNSGPAAASVRWIMVTDLALTAYRGDHGLDVTLRSLQSGRAMAGMKVQLLASNNDVLGETMTGTDGRVRFDKPLVSGRGNDAPRMVLAFGETGDLAVLDLYRSPVDLSSEETGGRYVKGDVDGFLYTERGIYRPGETVHLTSLMRTRSGFAVENRSGSIIVRRPNGLEADRLRFENVEGGGIDYDYHLSDSSARGVWTASLDIDGIGSVGAKSFTVEDFVPQRISVDVEGDIKTPIKQGGSRGIFANARFLYGAPGAGLTVQSQARIEVDPSPFENFSGFAFGERGETFREQIVELPDQTADGEGKALLEIDPGRNTGASSGRPLRINTVISVLEPGGRAVTDSVRIPYRPSDLYLGIRPDKTGDLSDKGRGFELAAISADGEAMAAEMAWKVISIVYHYDWYKDGANWRWRRSRSVNTVNEGIARSQDGATASIKVDGLESGSYELIVTSGRRKASQSFYIGWGGSVSDDGIEAPDRVDISVPEAPAKVGRDMQIAITPPYDGIAEITVATDRVLSVQSREVSRDGSRISLPVSEDWGEGAYIMVTVYSPRDPVFQAKPRRALGVTYVPVEMASRTFELTINAPDIARPRQERLITVDIKGGPREPVFLTLAAVDEGILQLTKFASPNAPAHYFGKKSLGVSLYDDYGRLLDPNLGMPSEVRTGGDQLGGEGLSVVPTKTVALYSGIVDVGRSGKAEIRFDLPDFNGELRLMAVAWSASGLGSASQAMIVRDKVPAELILPRFLAPGDEAFATASIDNVEGEAGAYKASMASIGGVETTASEVTRTLQKGQRADESLRLMATGEGISQLTLEVDGPDGFRVDHTYPIQTRSAFFPVSRVSRVLMEPGDKFTFDPAVFNGLQAGSRSLSVSFSSLPVDAGALYASLSRYPYGCTEQTVSRVMPLLYAEQLVDLDDEVARDDGARTRIQESVTTLLNRQSADGAFGLWRESDRYASPWLGAYTTDFLYRAKEAGYSVPNEALERAYDLLQTVAQGDAWRVYGYETDVWESQWHSDTQVKLMQRSSAYALYVLAKAGKADVSRLRYLHDRNLSQIESPLARAHIAAALAHMGDRSRAASGFQKAIAALGYNNSGDYYQTPRRDMAGVFALVAETGFNDLLTGLADKLGDNLPDPQNMTTQEKAFMLLAVNAMVGDEGGVTIDAEGLGANNDNEERYLLSEAQATDQVSFTLGGTKPLFRTLVARGTPMTAPPAISQKLEVTKTYHQLNGQRASLGQVSQGDQLVVIIKLEPGEDRNNPLIIADLLPAGFEIETVLSPGDGRVRDGDDDGAFAWAGPISTPRTSQARDDRYVAAIDLQAANATLAYIVRAVTPGDFVLPGVTAEDMYRPEVQARSEAGRVVVAPAGGSASGRP